MFTPGPWKVDGGKNVKGDFFIWQSGDYYGGHGLAQIFREGAVMHGGSIKANAQLIASAPDLLAACEWVLQDMRASLAILEQVINKAKGE